MDLRVNPWLDLQEAIFADRWRPSIERFRSTFAFRGAPRVSHALDTRLQTG